jgi:predicted membrane protein
MFDEATPRRKPPRALVVAAIVVGALTLVMAAVSKFTGHTESFEWFLAALVLVALCTGAIILGLRFRESLESPVLAFGCSQIIWLAGGLLMAGVVLMVMAFVSLFGVK